jgi:hypothetical protein
MDEKQMAEIIRQALENHSGIEADGSIRISTFEDEGVLTCNEGLVVRVDGSKFQLTIVKCR